MEAWGLPPSQWYANTRDDRAFMKARTVARQLIEAMLRHDMAEETRRLAELERKKH